MESVDLSKADPKQKIKYTKLFINNEFVDSVSGKTFSTINPATAASIAQVSEADKADVDKAVDAAKKAFARGSAWRKLDASARGLLLLKLADLIEENRNELANLESLNNGKSWPMAYLEVGFLTGSLRYYAGWADKFFGQTIPADGNTFVLTRREPIGVVGQIIPWNYPLLLLGIKLGPALATGCTVVVKPAEQTPLSALFVASLVKEAGFPPGVINILPGFGPTAGAAVSEHPGIRKVAFTGSTEVGHTILKTAGETNLKRVTLELGGKSPLVIFDDADLDSAVQHAYYGIYTNAGQTCVAPTRVFVQAGIYDEFVKKATAIAKATKVGDAFTPGVLQGPQIDLPSFRKVLELIESGKSQGAKLQTGGGRLGTTGFFVQPTVFSDVTDDMRIAKEEIFGPVQSILKFETLDEVIRRSNNTHYGLAAGCFTRNIETALEYAKAVEAGSVWVNQYGAAGSQLPFGGYKESGIGRECGAEGLEAYLETKTICIKLPSNH